MCQYIKTKGDIPKAVSIHTADVINDKIYIFGGGTWDFCTNDLHALDINNKLWNKIIGKGKSPDKRIGHSSCHLE